MLPGPRRGRRTAPATGGRGGDGRLQPPVPACPHRPGRLRRASGLARTRAHDNRPRDLQGGHMPKPIITAALTGPVATKADNPGMPGNVAEIAADAKACYEAGAAVIHIHLRDEQGGMTADLDVARRTVEAVREVCPGITQLSTGGLQFTYEQRMALVEAKPAMATLEPVHHDVRHGRVQEPAQADDGAGGADDRAGRQAGGRDLRHRAPRHDALPGAQGAAASSRCRSPSSWACAAACAAIPSSSPGSSASCRPAPAGRSSPSPRPTCR